MDQYENERRKELFDQDQEKMVEMTLEYDKKFSLIREENNNTIRNILIFEGAILTVLITSINFILGLNSSSLEIYFFISSLFTICSIIFYALLLKKISSDTIYNLAYSKHLFAKKIKERKQIICDPNNNLTSIKDKINLIANNNSAEEKKLYFIENYYSVKIPKYLREFLYKFDHCDGWVPCISHLANYSFLISTIALMFLLSNIFIVATN